MSLRQLTLLSLLALSWPCLAQEEPPPPAQESASAGRVQVAFGSNVDGEAEKPNSLQYFVWERLNNFGVRVESEAPIGDERLERFVKARAEKWAKADGEAGAPAVAIRIEGSAECAYNNSEFFGQGQAHNFRGKLEARLLDGQGQVLASFKYEHSWGRLPTNYTRRQVLHEYNNMVFSTFVVALLSDERVQALVPARKREAMQAWLREAARKVLEPLQASNMADCDLVRTLRELGLLDEEEGGKDQGGDGQGD